MPQQPEPARKRRILGFLAVACVALALPACESGGHFCVLGYSTKPNYNRDIRTVYVPIFKNKTFRRGLEFDLTRTVIRQIEEKTPYKVVSDCNGADTELIGTITAITKSLVNINPENEVREAEMTMAVEIIWRDRRTGEILSRQVPARNILVPDANNPLVAGPALNGAPGMPTPAPISTGGNDRPPPYIPAGDEQPVPPTPPPVLVQAVDHYIPELGQSTATGMQGTTERIATQIVSMMESPW